MLCWEDTKKEKLPAKEEQGMGRMPGGNKEFPPFFPVSGASGIVP